MFWREDRTSAASGVLTRGAAIGMYPPSLTATHMVAAQEDGIDRSARRALEQFAPAYVVIDRASDIIRFSGGTIARAISAGLPFCWSHKLEKNSLGEFYFRELNSALELIWAWMPNLSGAPGRPVGW